MKNNRAPRGFLGLTLAIIVGVLALGALLDVYVTHHPRASSSAPVATTTEPITATSSEPVATSTPEPKPVPPVTTTTSTTITQADSGKTIHLHPGDRLVLMLSDTLNWSGPQISDTDVISRVSNIMVVKGSQGVFEAHTKGTATLTATGAPICSAGEACPQFIALFTVTIVVD